jgi:NAD(P)-dependent dehydrogenase (short-subunit alcohol dehydrogenase family)
MSKHALEAFTRSLRRELLMHGVDVIAVGPGAVKTPIWKKADDVDADIYKDTEYHEILLGMRKMFKEANEQGLPAEAIGKLVHKILTVRKPKPRYAVLKNKFLFYTLPRLMPERMLDKVMADKIGISIRKLS